MQGNEAPRPGIEGAASLPPAAEDTVDRRAFMERFGKYALYTPPVVATLLFSGRKALALSPS